MTRQSYPTIERSPPPVRLPLFKEDEIDHAALYRHLADWLPRLNSYLRRLGLVTRNSAEGKANCVADVTLTANVATTTLTDPRIGPHSYIGFMPTTANAATELATLFVTARGDGSCTLNHANNAQADRVYTYDVMG